MPNPRRRSLPFQLDFRSRLPVYVQLFQRVQGLALSGRLQPGDQLPTVRELAAQLGVNFNTVARAYRQLDSAGVVSAQQGRGTFMLEKPTARPAPRATLEALASRYIAEARRQNFSKTQIAATVARRLKAEASRRAAGDSHG